VSTGKQPKVVKQCRKSTSLIQITRFDSFFLQILIISNIYLFKANRTDYLVVAPGPFEQDLAPLTLYSAEIVSRLMLHTVHCEAGGALHRVGALCVFKHLMALVALK
jgi:hypothetical protein